MKREDIVLKIFRNGCLTVLGILILCGILFMVLNILIVNGMYDNARLADKKSCFQTQMNHLPPRKHLPRFRADLRAAPR